MEAANAALQGAANSMRATMHGMSPAPVKRSAEQDCGEAPIRPRGGIDDQMETQVASMVQSRV